MGKILLIGVILLTGIFAAITLTIQRRTAKVPEMLSKNLAEQRAANLGAYALLYGINQIDKGALPRPKIPFGGGFYTQNFTDFYALDGEINRLRYAALDATKDTIRIIANVTCIVGADTVRHESEAAFSGRPMKGNWKMDEDKWYKKGWMGDIALDKVIDISGYDNHGTGHPCCLHPWFCDYKGPNTIAEGKYGRAGEFDGIGDYVDCGNDTSLNITNAITAVAWVKPLPTPSGLIGDFEDRGYDIWEEIFEGGSEVWSEAFEYRGDEIFEDDFEDGNIDGWTTGGDANWFATNGQSHEGTWSARSGNIGSNQHTDIYKDITGPATITFWWKVSSQADADYLQFYVDDIQIWAISGEQDWNKKVYSVEGGIHTIKWKYQKDGSLTSGSDRGWIDDISITDKGLGEGWNTGGDRDWYVTDIYTPHGGNWSAKSGDIGDSKNTYIERKIEGPAAITFWWKVSSQADADYLQFYVDDIQIWAISGEQDWNKKVYSVGEGTHTIKWKYQKDGSGTSGSDSGWIDDISITDIGFGEGWTTGGHNWYVTDQYPANSGKWCAKSGDIGDGETSWLKRTVTGPATITFNWKASSEPDCDFLEFLVDGRTIFARSDTIEVLFHPHTSYSIEDGYVTFPISYIAGWNEKTYSITGGDHTIEWRYTKNESSSMYEDAGWIDDIRIYNRGLVSDWSSHWLTPGWSSGGSGGRWYVEPPGENSESWSARAPSLKTGQISTLWRECVMGPAIVSFRWKCSCWGFSSYHASNNLKFRIYNHPPGGGSHGKTVYTIRCETDWEKREYLLKEGHNTLRFQYIWGADSPGPHCGIPAGQNTGWIDDIKVTTTSSLSEVLTKGNAYGIYANKTTEGEMTAGWTTNGHKNWYVTDQFPTHSGKWCAKSGNIGASQYTDNQKTIKGPATITFWWKVSSQSNADYLKFYVDDKPIWKISGEKSWHKKVYSVEEGTHIIKWQYQKDDKDISGLDCGWIDDISITEKGLGEGWKTQGHRNWYVTDQYPALSKPWCAKSGDIEASQYTDLYRTVEGPATITFGWKVSSQSDADYLKFYVDNKHIWAICGETGWQKKVYSIQEGTHTLKWRYQKDGSSTSGLDCGWIDDISITDEGLEGWDTSGHRNWYVTNQYPTHSGSWCAKSGDIGNNQYTDLDRTVKGPKNLNFWWKVSSRSGSHADYLQFYVDDEQIWKICGNKNWQKKIYSIPAGDHNIKWRYHKDDKDTSHDDSGWIDDITCGFSDNFESRGKEVWSEKFPERGSAIFKDDFEAGGSSADTLSVLAFINGNIISADISSIGWAHIALTYDKDAGANNQKLYLNGILVNSTTLTGPININTNKLLFGKSYKGVIDEVAIFDEALSAEDIMHIYKFGASHKIIYWIE